jgi:heat shock protein HslJ
VRGGRTLGRLVVLALLLGAGLVPGTVAQGRTHRQVPEAPAPKKSPEKLFPFNESFILVSINGKPVAGADPPSLTVDHTLRARGFGGCNTFSMAYYPIKNQTLAAGAIATTRKACSPEVMTSERGFLVTLHSLPKWDVTPEGDLVLKTSGTTLRFRRGI